MFNSSATSNKFAQFKRVAVAVAAGTATTTATADAELVGGFVLSATYNDTDAADKFINKVAISATGEVTVTLSGNSTATVTVDVIVALASGNIA